MAKHTIDALTEGLSQAVEAVEKVAARELSSLEDPIFHREVSVRAHLAHTLGPLVVKPLMGHLPLIRPTFMALRIADHLVGLTPTLIRGVTRTTVRTDTWSAHLYEAREVTCGKTIVYFHGGAFLACGLGTHRAIAEALAVENGCAIMSVAYRQYPQVLFDQTVEDGVEAVKWLLKMGTSAENIVLAGDSAGGGLAVRVAGDLLEAGVRLGGVIALSAWLDFDSSAKRAHRLSRRDAYIPSRRLEAVAKLILGREPQPEDSPLASLSENFPPLLMICGANEVLRVDTELAHARARELGISCETHYFRGGIHAFPVATRVFPEGPKARNLMRDFIKRLSSGEVGDESPA